MSKEKVWFIGDCHFGHKRIIELCGRPFSSIEEMELNLIKNWNRKIKSSDRVFITGDFALCGKAKIIEIGQKLNGRKILIAGNHDGASIQTYHEAGFEAVVKYPILFNGYIISHEPVQDYWYKNIHAHNHNKGSNDVFQFSTSVEQIGYSPIEFGEIEEYFKGFEDGV